MIQELAHRLLLFEDNPGDALLVSEALAEFDNYTLSLEPVVSPKQALDALRSRTFDDIILDLTLPDSLGVETLARVAEATEAVPIVVLTGLDGGGGLREKAEQLGAFEFVCKNEMAQLLPRGVYWSLRHKRAEARHREFERLLSAIPDAVIVAAA
jgi:CheY-like chemotaxis protein